jgi:RNA polymerase sigma-70 factor (ECF subfamily)
VSLDDALDIPDKAAAASADAELLTLRHAIMRLPIEYREPLVMQVLGGFSTEEIARELALTNTAVLTRLFRARAKLRGLCGPNPEPGAAPGERPA